MVTRRRFFETLGAAAAGAVGLACSRPAPLTMPSIAPRPIGIQLYTVRDLMQRDFDGTLARLAEIGYREVEFAGYFGRTPAQVHAALAQQGLVAPSAHIDFPASDASWSAALDAARVIGHQWVVIPWIDEAKRRTRSDWRRVAARLNELASMAHRAGLRFAYHNHEYDLRRDGEGTFLDLLLHDTDAALVDFEMDVYWVTKGGGDPLALIRRYPTRFTLLHLKDATAAPERRMVDVGRGTIDFAAIIAAARPAHVFVEHDDPPDPLASAKASFDYLARLPS